MIVKYMIMQLKSIVKVIGQMSIRADFRERFIKSEAEGEFKASSFEEIEAEPLEEQEDEFTLEIDQPATESVKTQQFNAAMVGPLLPSPSPHPPNLTLSPRLIYGYNSMGRNTACLLSEQVQVIAIGNILCLYHLDTKVPKIYIKHKQAINSLHYNDEEKMLVSGCVGKHPEIMVWGYKQDSNSLQHVKTYYQARKSQGVQLLWMTGHHLVSIDTISLHRGCSLYLFDHHGLVHTHKLGQRVFDVVLLKNNPLVITNKGVRQCTINSNTLTITQLSNKKYTCGVMYQQSVWYGDMDGSIHDGNKQWNIHRGCINLMAATTNLIFTSGAEEAKVKALRLEAGCLNTVWKVELQTYCTCMCVRGEMVWLGGRDGTRGGYTVGGKPILQQPYGGSCQQTTMTYSKHSNRLIIPMLKDTINSIKMISFPPSPEHSILSWDLKEKTECVDVYGHEVVQVKEREGTRDILIYEIGGSLVHEIKVVGEVAFNIVKYNGLMLVLGDTNGKVSMYKVKEEIWCYSQDHHSGSIEQIDWESSGKYIRTVSGCEMFYWELKQGELVKVKAKLVKQVQWEGTCKYQWQSKKIWDTMTHYQDICSIASITIQHPYLAVAMYDGTLRVYACPPNKNQYQSFKLFDGRFSVVGKESWLACLYKGSLLYLQLTQ